MMNKIVKLYEVTFMAYTDASLTKVYNGITNEYLDIKNTPMVIQEDQIGHYMNFGDGINSMKFIGYLHDKNKK